MSMLRKINVTKIINQSNNSIRRMCMGLIKSDEIKILFFLTNYLYSFFFFVLIHFILFVHLLLYYRKINIKSFKH